MSDVAIKVENLSKRYRIGREEEMHETLAGQLASYLKSPMRNLRRLRQLTRFGENGQGPAQDPDDVIWALKDVSFEVKRGEVVGIIGRNGAGKSTLLKILSRITHPTSGRVVLNGRVSSLLEVGTGFHPELTGRENVYLNGTILGMRKAEVDAKFDEIVAFSGVEQFIDTPVKRYSSGMKVRLAFSVAAHLDPEILLVDEVLSVGDAEFRKKCLGKMHSVAEGGRTIFFVSHNMAAIGKLCKEAMLLNQGHLVERGVPDDVIGQYLTREMNKTQCWRLDNSQLSSLKRVRITNVQLLDMNKQLLSDLSTGRGFILRIEYALDPGVEIPAPSFVVRFKSYLGVEMFRLSNTPISGFPISRLRGSGHVELVVPILPFAAGQYSIDVALARQGQEYFVDLEDVVFVHIRGHDVYQSGETVDLSRSASVVTHRWIHFPEAGKRSDSGWIGNELLQNTRD